MVLFGLIKRKGNADTDSGCSCSTGENSGTQNKEKSMIYEMKVLGAGCKTCHAQYEEAMAAAKHMGLAISVEYITDMERVMSYGAMRMPILVVNGRVVAMGKLLKANEIETLLHGCGF